MLVLHRAQAPSEGTLTDTDDLLRDASRCVLALSGSGVEWGAPVLSPMAFWYDGSAVWMTTAATPATRAGPRRGVPCAVYVPPVGGSRHGVVIGGEARVHSLDDPVGLVLHSAPISAAMTALVAKNLPAMPGYARDLARAPEQWQPRNRVILRVGAASLRSAPLPVAGRGVAPALPDVVPADVRRAVAGRRYVVLATGTEEDLHIQPAVWGAGYQLQTAAGAGTAAQKPATVAVDASFVDADFRDADSRDADPREADADAESGRANVGRRLGEARGVAVHGFLGPDLRLRAERVTWWRGFEVESAAIPTPPAGGVVLPE